MGKHTRNSLNVHVTVVTKDNMAISISVLSHQSVAEPNVCAEMNIAFTVDSNGELINRTPK